MAIVLKSESMWVDEEEVEMMEIGRDSNDPTKQNLFVRTSWVDAWTAYSQVSKRKSGGKRKTLWLRYVMQKYLVKLGNFIQFHCGKVVFLGLIALSMCCLGLRTIQMESDIEKLWIDAGNRLSREMKYTENTLGINVGELNEVIIQVPREEGGNVLTVERLLSHLEVLKVAISVSVEVVKVVWKFQDLCHTIPLSFDEDNELDKILQELEPCLIMTPLECFWEGSKLFGPEKPVKIPNFSYVNWTNLNPMEITQALSDFMSPSLVDAVNKMFERAGISTAYQEKPCLNPYDPGCPETAPNFLSKELPDVASVLANGCDGFAKNYIHWKEDLILGGIHRNKSGSVVKAEALQTTIPLMGEKTLYEAFKLQLIIWNETVAAEVIRLWEKQLAVEIEKFTTSRSDQSEQGRASGVRVKDKVYSFTSRNLKELLQVYSRVSYVRIVLGFLLMMCYSCVVMVNIKKCEESQVAATIAGLFLLAISSAAGLGLCSFLDLTFNAMTTQVVPFLVVGFGIDHVFLILHTYSQLPLDSVPYEEQTGNCLKRVGALILASSICNSSGFLLASVIPVPATRFFSLQCCLLILVNSASTLLIFPAMVSIDLWRRKSGRVDVFCCHARPTVPDAPVRYIRSQSDVTRRKSSSFKQPWTICEDDFTPFTPHNFPPSSAKEKPHRSSNTPERGSFVDRGHKRSRKFRGQQNISSERVSGLVSSRSSQELLGGSSSSSVSMSSTSSSRSTEFDCEKQSGEGKQEVCYNQNNYILSEFVRRFYGPFLEKLPVKVIVTIIFVIAAVLGFVGIPRVKEGLDQMDITPSSSSESEFFRVQSKYFGFHNFFVATQNFDYASEQGQHLLYSLHHSFSSISNIIRRKDGNFPEFWLEIFRNWLLGVQRAFDKDMKSGAIKREGWLANSSSLGKLGYKLMVQTGIKSDPFDKQRIFTGRLVKNGVVYSPAFYVYLSAWASNDALVYSLSQASIKPDPKPWYHDENDPNLTILPSSPIIFAQSAFYLNNLYDGRTTMDVLSEIRNICDSYTSRGLPNYPHGLVIMIWEQYFTVRFYLIILIVSLLAIIYTIVLIVLLNPFAAFLEVFILVCTLVELYGFMGWTGIKMSALSAVIIIITIGATVQSTVPLALAFQTSIGPRDRRMFLALEQSVTSSTHTFIAALLGLLVLATSEFPFIVKYIFGPFVMMLVFSYFNGLVFFPVLLSLVGPTAEVIPLNNDLYLPPPSPVAQPQIVVPSKSKSGQKAAYKTRRKSKSLSNRRNKTTSRLRNHLATIVEESSGNSCESSISIDLKPTIIISSTSHCCGSSPTGQSQSSTPSSCFSSSRSSGDCSCGETNTKLCSSSNSYHLDSATGVVTDTTPPLQVSACSSNRHVTTVEATTKVKVHICEQKDKHSSCEVTTRPRNRSRMSPHNVGCSSERHSTHVHSRARRC